MEGSWPHTRPVAEEGEWGHEADTVNRRGHLRSPAPGTGRLDCARHALGRRGVTGAAGAAHRPLAGGAGAADLRARARDQCSDDLCAAPARRGDLVGGRDRARRRRRRRLRALPADPDRLALRPDSEPPRSAAPVRADRRAPARRAARDPSLCARLRGDGRARLTLLHRLPHLLPAVPGALRRARARVPPGPRAGLAGRHARRRARSRSRDRRPPALGLDPASVRARRRRGRARHGRARARGSRAGTAWFRCRPRPRFRGPVSSGSSGSAPTCAPSWPRTRSGSSRSWG